MPIATGPAIPVTTNSTGRNWGQSCFPTSARSSSASATLGKETSPTSMTATRRATLRIGFRAGAFLRPAEVTRPALPFRGVALALYKTPTDVGEHFAELRRQGFGLEQALVVFDRQVDEKIAHCAGQLGGLVRGEDRCARTARVQAARLAVVQLHHHPAHGRGKCLDHQRLVRRLDQLLDVRLA